MASRDRAIRAPSFLSPASRFIMIQVLAEAEPRPPHTDIDETRHIGTLGVDTLTAVVLDVWRHSDGRHGARLNAYVDGLGHRTLQAELTAEGYDRALGALQRPGVLVRCSGMLVGGSDRPHLLALDELRVLAPDDSH
jgi:hypothetical protein